MTAPSIFTTDIASSVVPAMKTSSASLKLIQRAKLFVDGYAELAGQVEQNASGDARQNVGTNRRGAQSPRLDAEGTSRSPFGDPAFRVD